MFLMLPKTSLWKSYALNVDTQQLAYSNLCLTTFTTTSATYFFHKRVVQELAYGKVMFLMLPTTSLCKSCVLNIATEQLADSILA